MPRARTTTLNDSHNLTTDRVPFNSISANIFALLDACACIGVRPGLNHATAVQSIPSGRHYHEHLMK